MITSENSYAPGFPCPECRRPIVVPIHQLALQPSVVCAWCGLELTIVREESPVLRHVETLSETLSRIPGLESSPLLKPGEG
jgi:hypothetical protein